MRGMYALAGVGKTKHHHPTLQQGVVSVKFLLINRARQTKKVQKEKKALRSMNPREVRERVQRQVFVTARKVDLPCCVSRVLDPWIFRRHVKAAESTCVASTMTYKRQLESHESRCEI